MKKFILTIIAGASVIASAFAQSLTINHTATPTLFGNNLTPATTFTFALFNSDLGTLTGVDLLLTSTGAVSGSVSVNTTSSLETATLNSFTSHVRSQGTGLSQVNSSPISMTTNPAIGTTVPAGTTQAFTFPGSQSLISSTQTYNISPANWSSYQIAGGVGNTPSFTGRLITSLTISSDNQPSTDNSAYSAIANYTLRYTYSTGPVPIPEPGQVAASLLLLGGIGAYVFIKRRKKSAPAAA